MCFEVETQNIPKFHLCNDEILKPRFDNFCWRYTKRRFPIHKNFRTEEANHEYNFLKIGRAVVKPGSKSKIPLRMLNAGNNYLKVYAHSHIADLHEIEEMDDYEVPELEEKQ